MKSYCAYFLPRAALVAVAAVAAGLASAPEPAAANPNVLLWDTLSPLSGQSNVGERSGWKRVPSDLLLLEADPPKASSDPGYYGREYAFKGDAVVQNQELLAVFRSATGRLELYAESEAARPAGAAPSTAPPSRKLIELAPLQTKAQPGTLSRVTVLRNAADEVALNVAFSATGSPEISSVFVFGKTAIIEVKPAPEMKGISLLGPIRFGIAPSFIGDDLLFDPADYPSANSLWIAAEDLFLGLLEGENSELVMTWPRGNQRLALHLGPGEPAGRVADSIDFDNDGQSLYLAPLVAPGLWHKEALAPSFLEKDVTSQWKRPFPARWKTQLSEDGVATTFAFRPSKGQVWRGVAGSYNYPVWFNGQEACFRLSKKVPPQGQSLIYFLEGQETPPWVWTPSDILKATLGRAAAEPILDIAGRKLRTHHRRGGQGVRRACTCGCTEAIQAVFEAGEEVEKKDYIQSAVDDMIYFVHRHVERIDQYMRFADDLTKFLQAKAASAPQLKPFLDQLEPIARQIPEEYAVQKENMKSFAYADQLTAQTLALAGKKDPNNLKAYMELLNAWRGMGGAQDYVVAQCHTIARKLAQRAGYACVNDPQAATLAQEIRSRCRQCLRNPDGYEIWADY